VLAQFDFLDRDASSQNSNRAITRPNFVFEIRSPYGTIDLLIWEGKVLAKEDALCAAINLPGDRWGLHARHAIYLRANFSRAIIAVYRDTNFASGIAHHASPLIRFFGANRSPSTRQCQSSRIPRKLLKTLTGTPVYPTGFSAGSVAQNHLPFLSAPEGPCCA
jgi:hypothetical protein